MKTVLYALAALLAGYFIGALIGGTLILLTSGNTHDKGMEVVMTAAFVTGPIGAIIGLIVGLIRGRRPTSA